MSVVWGYSTPLGGSAPQIWCVRGGGGAIRHAFVHRVTTLLPDTLRTLEIFGSVRHCEEINREINVIWYRMEMQFNIKKNRIASKELDEV